MRPNRLLLFLVSIFLTSGVFSQRPNFIIILLDDAHEQSLPPAGPSFLHYPSIERIYNEGVNFCDAYCIDPLCNPSRNTMFTGMYPHTHGAVDDATLPKTDLPTFFSITADQGYHNEYVGKYSNLQYKDLPGIEKLLTITTITQVNPKMYDHGEIKTIQGHTTVIIDDTSEAWLSVIDTPFVFGIGHIGTHSPIDVLNAYKNTYNGMAKLPDNYFKYTVDFPSFLYADPDANANDSNKVKVVREKLFEIMGEIDRGVSNIFSVLESRGILDNTMIIFTNDNGFLLGEHQLAGK